MSAHDQKHPYHLVDPSPWPLLSSFAAGFMVLGGVFAMHDKGAWLFILGLAAVVFCMVVWWRDVLRETGFHNNIVQLGLRYGVVLFIASEVMFFFAFFWAYFNASLFPVGGVWPPEDIITFDPFDLPFLNTLLLLLSGVTVTWAHQALVDDDNDNTIKALTFTVLLGVVFLCLQAYEYSHAAFSFTDGIYPTVFFMATGFHGFHVFVGTVFLAVCLYRAIKKEFKPDHHVGFEAAAWYWHFVDVVWLFLFVAVYIYGA